MGHTAVDGCRAAWSVWPLGCNPFPAGGGAEQYFSSDSNEDTRKARHQIPLYLWAQYGGHNIDMPYFIIYRPITLTVTVRGPATRL